MILLTIMRLQVCPNFSRFNTFQVSHRPVQEANPEETEAVQKMYTTEPENKRSNIARTTAN